jgi:hypothetical protein
MAEPLGAGDTGDVVAEAAGAGDAGETVADAVGAGAAVDAVADALGAGDVVADALGAGDAMEAAGADVLPVAATGIAGVPGPGGAGVTQVAARPAASLDALSAVLTCGAMRIATPTARTTARNPAIMPGCALDCLPRLR